MGSFSPFEPVQPTILTVPGLGGSGPSHWQTLWERSRPDTVRAELGMWNTPHRNAWVTKLDQAIRAAQAAVILAAHSLGCVLVAWWAAHAAAGNEKIARKVAGALLVAPADTGQDSLRAVLPGWAPVMMQKLPFPSIVVGSESDPYCTLARAQAMAHAWGSRFVNAGAAGHINTASGLGNWDSGHALLQTFQPRNGS